MKFVTVCFLREPASFAEYIIPVSFFSVLDYRSQTLAKMRMGRSDSGVVHNRGVKINQFCQRVGYTRVYALAFWRLDNERHPGRHGH